MKQSVALIGFGVLALGTSWAYGASVSPECAKRTAKIEAELYQKAHLEEHIRIFNTLNSFLTEEQRTAVAKAKVRNDQLMVLPGEVKDGTHTFVFDHHDLSQDLIERAEKAQRENDEVFSKNEELLMRRAGLNASLRGDDGSLPSPVASAYRINVNLSSGFLMLEIDPQDPTLDASKEGFSILEAEGSVQVQVYKYQGSDSVNVWSVLADELNPPLLREFARKQAGKVCEAP